MSEPEPLPDAKVYVLSYPDRITSDLARQWREMWKEHMPGTELLIVDSGGTLEPLGHQEWQMRVATLLERMAIALEHLDDTKSRQAEYEGWLNE